MKPQFALFALGWPELLILVIIWGGFGAVIGLLARRKHRKAWAWGAIGGCPCLFFPATIVLMFMSFLCPKCRRDLSNQEWKQRTCPRCGDIKPLRKTA